MTDNGLIEDPWEKLIAIYVSHKEVSLETIGRLSDLKEEIYRLGMTAQGIVVLSTCNRFEVYIHKPTDRLVYDIKNLFKEKGVKPRTLKGIKVAKRLFRIASGLESRILGEPEILGQVREAWRESRLQGRSSFLLNTIFHHAIITGKRVRSETGISRGHASYPSAAVFYAVSKIGSLDGKRVAVIGAGEAGLRILRIVCNDFAPSNITLYTRNPDKAFQDTSRICPGVKSKPRSELVNATGYDVIFVAVNDPFGLENVPLKARIVVDLSVPPAVKGDNVYTIEELEDIVSNVIKEREKWVGSAEEIIEEELEKLIVRVRERKISSLLKIMLEYSQRLAEKELAKANSCSNIDRLLSSYSKKLLHPLIVGLREGASRAWRIEDLIQILEKSYYQKLLGGGDNGSNGSSRISHKQA
ncbi:MAG: NAD(P)-binding domain-containing protein [Desulfurococcales archaeon]|nr:NAD(P)-binding domain-containing protein [Desulfurococcales archaeon]